MYLKKITSVLLAVVLCVCLLEGCGIITGMIKEAGTDKNTSSEREAGTDRIRGASAQDGSDGRQEVTIWYYWETEGHQKGLDKVIRDYNDSQSEIVVNAEYIPFADFKKQLSIGASSDELPDIAIMDSPDHASYAVMGIFADLTDKFDVSDYYEEAVASCTIGDTLYGIPFGVNCLALYYNEDLLRKAGCEVPKNWEELKETAKKLTNDKVTGFAFSALQNEEGTFNFMPWIWSAGADYYEINSEEGIKALTLIRDLVASGVMSEECINWTQGDVMNQFISGNVAMMVNGPWQIPTMNEQAPDMNWKAALLPSDQNAASILGGENYAVIAGGNEEAALKFLEYATAKEQVEYLMDAFGYIAADRTIASGQFTDDATMKVFLDELDHAKARPALAEWPEISEAVSIAFNQVITGEKQPQDAAALAQQSIDEILMND